MYYRFYITKLTPCQIYSVVVRGILRIYISQITSPINPIREKYPNHPKSHKLKNLVFIAESENTIWRNSDVSNFYTFLYANLEGVKFYDARKYLYLKK